ncbi:hypothetical protein AJ85_18500 [Alkalihalobacillus alcalophilus ATCC 27647 = CGMCC 1.3604]|uniref:Uncharacterized protein n=1 Tax=Alkalihalobacillus alcalophilus ATCC 27647 = CGMCC 1.3604 TaxID=1218173 RepID=A0A094WK04_ALKAL|nr:DUF6220 domain-containing protein [Alkalihalobacillus alcalophilus]KGA98109.1 hypothetical protein BALCAV_0206160 [Alkalihalobacillus alcalophilus ATCC 27647 = CGMCC 1.3604]MED1561446.1 DUF6220 domain-containing protein [Alkalihalobacillus alcalophilus]THG89295.1 hypothetical protein AJ85_18500 [Alkalihalobacillus alcalophilus ATCC 27647 = CGMCC 1.3604]
MKHHLGVTYFIFVCLALLAVLFQILIAGVALFENYSYWELHKAFAHFKYVYMLLFVIALFLKKHKTLIWLPLILFILANAQYYTAHGYIAALHVVIPIFITLLTVKLTFNSYQLFILKKVKEQ